MKEYIYFLKLVDRLKSGVWTKEDESIINDHVSYLSKLKDNKILVFAGRTQTDGENTVGLVLFYANSLEEASTTMKNDPAVNNGIMTGEVVEFSTAIQGQWK